MKPIVAPVGTSCTSLRRAKLGDNDPTGTLSRERNKGEQGERSDARHAKTVSLSSHRANLYTNFITSAVGLSEKTLAALAEAGLDHVQISIQDSDAALADRIGGYDGAYARKRALAREVVRIGILLTVNAVIHRANIDHIASMVDQAVALGASKP